MARQSSKPAPEGDAEKVGRHCDRIREMEAQRLELRSPVEYAMAGRYLQRCVPDGATVADIGVCVGHCHYSGAPARRGCTVHLVDVSARLPAAARSRLLEPGLGVRIGSMRLGSATNLNFLPGAHYVRKVS